MWGIFADEIRSYAGKHRMWPVSDKTCSHAGPMKKPRHRCRGFFGRPAILRGDGRVTQRTASNRPVAPMPPPTHMVTMP
ncbi:hypothetical protein PKB_3985 [Pseudomonas knackmussii B13]|uniref:Uncharacterized protein n=1 Tax=Pseudomonas knackmussii (strain DSM 6978 / CCUG 54928 / LMG 23759 / B13) TaxID=1301098 RepID=A0A024HKY4_PSEKB|nr:hypothetical protein PKB_3985 [Pseudomonas knackmussii B13]